MKTIVLDGQTYELTPLKGDTGSYALRPIEDKKPRNFKVSVVGFSREYKEGLFDGSIQASIYASKEQAEAIRDAVEALMEYIYDGGGKDYTIPALLDIFKEAKELLEENI